MLPINKIERDVSNMRRLYGRRWEGGTKARRKTGGQPG